MPCRGAVMEKALTPMAAKTALRVAIKRALGLRKNAQIDLEENFKGDTKSFRMKLPNKDGEDNSLGFTTYYFPGCCKYGIISQLFTSGKMRRKKLAPHVLNWALAQVSMDGYSKAVGTTSNNSNSVMEVVLKKAGWKRIDRGVNSNTDNIVTMWVQPTGKTSKKNTFMSCDS
jgi:hypothetical protein